MKAEYSKIVLGSVMLLYFAGAIFGGYIVMQDSSLLPELLAYIGAPTAVAIGFYAWKAKAENVLKIAKSKKMDTKTKKQVIDAVTGRLQDALEAETEDYNEI
jgi:arginine exporter protein ArgO